MASILATVFAFIEMENESRLKVFINGVPDIKEIPLDKLESLLAVLEMQISKYYENKDKIEVGIININFAGKYRTA